MRAYTFSEGMHSRVEQEGFPMHTSSLGAALSHVLDLNRSPDFE